jgi:DNA-directed RNA polymerase subunit beta
MCSNKRTLFLDKQIESKKTKLSIRHLCLKPKDSIFQKFRNSSFFTSKQNRPSPTTYFLQKYQRSNQDTSLIQRPAVKEGDWLEIGDLLADCATSSAGELSLGKNILMAYLPWEGYNYEDAILISERLVQEEVYTSIHIEKYETEIRSTQEGFEQITKKIPGLWLSDVFHLDGEGIARLGSCIQEGKILVGKVAPTSPKFDSPYQKLIYTILQKELSPFRDTSLRGPKNLNAKVIQIRIFRKKNKSVRSVQLYLAEKRNLQIGDKIAGRHGNKGIVSQILPREDMPYLPDGRPLDMVLNPLGVPSRMNVGQIYECLLGLAAQQLGLCFKIPPFDEIYGAEASRSLTYAKLSKAATQTGKSWLFHPLYPGKMRIFDGRTGENFDQAVTVGIAYILKLVHLVEDKIHARSTGPYSLVNQQPLRGRSKEGGQRLGEMEVWALQGYGAAFTLLEMLTLKSDDLTGRLNLWINLIQQKEMKIGTPESFKVLVCELQALCLDIGLYRLDSRKVLRRVENLIKLP